MPAPSPPSPPTPATSGQVQAHRFSLRRMQSALVRREAVPSTDPLRTHARAQIVGVVLAALTLGGFAIWGQIDRPVDWRRAAVVVGADSGAIYVVAGERLLPVPNLASARLVLAGGANEAPGGTPAAPVEVPDTVLAEAARLPPVGIPDAPALPPAGTPGPAVWSVCDTGSADPAPPSGASPWARPRVWTTVLANRADPGEPLPPGHGLLLRDRFGGTWLVHDGVRSRLDLTDPAVVVAFDLAGQLPRPVTTGLLNTLPEAPPIASPVIPGRGTPIRVDLAGEPVGGVVRLVGPGTPDRWYLVAADGVQEVPPVVARLVRLSDPTRAAVGVPTVSPNQLALVGTSRVVPVATYPDPVPVPVPMADARTTCASTGGGDRTPRLTLAAGPVPAGPTVTVAGADGAGDGLDAVAVPGSGVAARAVAPGRPDAPGTIVVVSGSGRVSGVPDPGTAAALGLGEGFAAAPEPVVGLLPPGPALTLDAARAPLVG